MNRIVAEEGNNYDCIVAFGGDGTLNEVINGLMRLPKRPVLGYIPAGTTNDFAAGLGLAGGVLYLGAILLLQRNVRENGVALSSLFMKLGVIVPAILGVTVFRERLAPTRAAGIALDKAA